MEGGAQRKGGAADDMGTADDNNDKTRQRGRGDDCSGGRSTQARNKVRQQSVSSMGTWQLIWVGQGTRVYENQESRALSSNLTTHAFRL